MNQQQTPKKTSPQPQRFVGRPIRLPEKCAPPKGLIITTVITAVLLVISLMILCIALLVAPTESPESDGGDGTQKKEPVQTNELPSGAAIKAKFLSFPSQTASGSYRSSSAVGVIREDSSLKSDAAILVDVSAGASIFERESDTKVYPASMTKVMTVLVACEAATDPTELLTVTPEMLEALNTKETDTVTVNGFRTSKGASTLGGWQAGDQITVEDALFLVNYKSDTVACWLLANRFGGGEDGFVTKMNQRAQSLGLSQTNFTNCTGLYEENHYTTCREMAAIMQAAMNNPAAKTVITSYREYVVQVYRDGKTSRSAQAYAAWYSERLENIPTVCNGSSLKFCGGKTGWETIPTSCFVTAVEDTQTGKWYICVTVGRISAAAESVGSAACAADARYLYRTYVDKVAVDWNKLL